MSFDLDVDNCFFFSEWVVLITTLGQRSNSLHSSDTQLIIPLKSTVEVLNFRAKLDSFFRDWSPAGATQQQLSVVTTVWGVTTSTQSGPHGTYSGGAVGPPPGANNGYGPQGLSKQSTTSFPGPYRQSIPGWVSLKNIPWKKPQKIIRCAKQIIEYHVIYKQA